MHTEHFAGGHGWGASNWKSKNAPENNAGILIVTYIYIYIFKYIIYYINCTRSVVPINYYHRMIKVGQDF